VGGLPELPPKFQNAFEAAKAKAELKYVNRAESSPHNPHFAESGLQQPIRVLDVFFAFCKEARNACRAGDWTAAQVSHAVETKWPQICDSFSLRERGASSAEAKSRFRLATWQVVQDDQRWKQHLSELAALAEAAVSHGTPAVPAQPGEHPIQGNASGPIRVGHPSGYETETSANDGENMHGRRDLLEKMSKNPKYKVANRLIHQAWADSHGLVADAHGRGVTLSEYVERNARTFTQGARAHVAIEDGTPIPARCREIDRLAKKCIRKFSETLAPQSKRLGKRNVAAAIDEFSRRVTQIAARSKQRIYEKELARSAREPGALTSRVVMPSRGVGRLRRAAERAGALADGVITPPRVVMAPAREPHRANRLIIRLPLSDQIDDVKLPKLTHEFPAAFSQSARAKVMTARLRAEDGLGAKKSSIREFGDAEELLRHLVLQVFVAFAEEACKLGMQVVLTAGEVESECLRFLKSYALAGCGKTTFDGNSRLLISLFAAV